MANARDSRRAPGTNSSTSTNPGTGDEEQYGYEAAFDPELNAKYTCPVCLAAMRDPVQTKCGHRFCKICLKKSSGHGRFARCPVDKTWYDTVKEVFNDTAMRREVMALNVKCDLHTKGCEWTGELRSLEEHTVNCPEVETDCPNKCGVTTTQKILHTHLNSCPQREEACLSCQSKIIAADMTKHQLLVCPKFPVNCVVCGEAGILREDIARHMDLVNGDCPLVTVKCVYQFLGCYFQDKRKNIAAHYEIGWNQHLWLMAARLAQNEERLSVQERQLAESIQKCSRLSNLVERQERFFEEQNILIQRQADQMARMEDTLQALAKANLSSNSDHQS